MRPHRLPLAHQEAADKALREMQQAGIIEPSESPWALPIVMVPNKGGQWRFCVDYRWLNEWPGLILQFRVLSFGLCNAPATFERLMNRVLAGTPQKECLVYLNDILAHGSSFEAALGALWRMLRRVAAAGLKLHPEKCHFIWREVVFLGHEKDRAFAWSEEHQEAFSSLQNALIRAPVLASPDPTLPFILDTDASNVGMGGVLAQTNHYALQWLMLFKEPEEQVACWIEELQAYDFTVVHRAGACHTNADALSCCPCTADGCHYCEQKEAQERESFAWRGRPGGMPVCCELQTVDVAKWRQQQEQDTDLQPVLQWVEAQQKPPWEEVAVLSTAVKGLWSKFGALRLCEGMLQHAWKEPATGESPRLCGRQCLGKLMELQALDILGSQKRFTISGEWQFCVLSFGLLMGRVLAGIPRKECLVFLNDILAHGSSFEVALGALRRMLRRVAAADLKLHPDKCHFIQRKVVFLGHKVGEEGISTMGDKVQAVRAWTTPTDQRQFGKLPGPGLILQGLKAMENSEFTRRMEKKHHVGASLPVTVPSCTVVGSNCVQPGSRSGLTSVTVDPMSTKAEQGTPSIVTGTWQKSLTQSLAPGHVLRAICSDTASKSLVTSATHAVGEGSAGKAEGLMPASATIRTAASQRRALAPEAFQSSSARSPDAETPAPLAYPTNASSFSISKLAIGNIVGHTGS
ncbi:hypothetical protein AAFF_G00192610 [Aldrovandia affinis]|uniref:ribonuclease H n=1 Tax=Aldrovandia affinis TaxID=143900 RepID=A0AAD7RJ89_9TELE|nr:hypothetical protein AAFF_G00192610 [Aldrovandia affinis]